MHRGDRCHPAGRRHGDLLSPDLVGNSRRALRRASTAPTALSRSALRSWPGRAARDAALARRAPARSAWTARAAAWSGPSGRPRRSRRRRRRPAPPPPRSAVPWSGRSRRRPRWRTGPGSPARPAARPGRRRVSAACRRPVRRGAAAAGRSGCGAEPALALAQREAPPRMPRRGRPRALSGHRPRLLSTATAGGYSRPRATCGLVSQAVTCDRLARCADGDLEARSRPCSAPPADPGYQTVPSSLSVTQPPARYAAARPSRSPTAGSSCRPGCR